MAVSQIYLLLLLLAVGLSGALAGVAWRRRAVPGGWALAWLLLATAEWALFSALEEAAPDFSLKLLCSQFEYFGIVSVAVLWLIFALQYSQNDMLLTRPRLAGLWLIPLATLILVWTNAWHGLIWARISWSPDHSHLDYQHGPAFWVTVGYSYLLILAGSFLILRAARNSAPMFRRQAGLMLAAVAVPWISNVIYQTEWNPLAGRDPTPIAFAVSGALMTLSIFRWRLFTLQPIARNAVVEQMTDGVVVADAAGLIIDVNPAADRLLNLRRVGLLGQPIESILSAWPAWLGQLQSAASLQVQWTDGPLYLDVSISVLPDRRGRPAGWVVVLHDVTTRMWLEAENRQLVEATQRRAVEAETLREAGAAVAASLDRDDIIERILEQLARVIPYDTASVQLLREREMEIVGSRGFADPAAVLGMRFSLDEATPGQRVFQERQPYLLADAQQEYAAFREPPHNHIHGWLGVPLIAQDRFLGMLALDSTQPGAFSAYHARLASAFADQVAIALQNAELLNEAQRLAAIDVLTGVFNRRRLFELAEVEYERACRYRRPLAVLMADIDHFKAVNDRYGHLVGDRVLREVAQACRAVLRRVDLIGRYGGEEFVMILPETPLVNAVQAAERLRAAIAQLVIATEAAPLSITISVGVTWLPEGQWAARETNDALQSLIEQADKALYSSKTLGRDQVSVFRG